MGSSISRIYDDYNDYEYFCKRIGAKPVNIHDSFHKHETELLNNLGYKNLHDYYEVIRKAEARNKKIDEILGE
jgi:hypothetical protein